MKPLKGWPKRCPKCGEKTLDARSPTGLLYRVCASMTCNWMIKEAPPVQLLREGRVVVSREEQP